MRLYNPILTTATTLFVLLAGWTACASAQENVNIMLFYERPESTKSFDAAIDYIKQNPSTGISIGNVYKVMTDEPEATKLIQKLCKEIDTAHAQAVNDTEPLDLILDFTRHGIPSEAVKMIAKVINLPTVSATFGQKGDIRSWSDLTDKQKNYLIQIAPPPDMVAQAVRSLASKQDMMNAVLLFDDEYEMTHKYKSLFENLKTRNLLQNLEIPPAGIRRQIDRLVHTDITNFFIAATPNHLSEVLATASDPNMADGPFTTEEFAWYTLSMEPGLPKCHACRSNVSIIHLSPEFPTSVRTSFLEQQDFFKTKRLIDMFLFDLTMNAISAVSKMKKNGDWVSPPKRICSETTEINDDYTLNLFDNLKSPEISQDNLLGPFHFDPEKIPGNSHAKFKMTIQLVAWKAEMLEPFTIEKLGYWETGFGNQELITVEAGKEDRWKVHVAQTVYRIVTVVQPPFVYKIPGCQESMENKYSRCFVGLCIDLLDRLQQELNFNYTIRNVTYYGNMNEQEPHEWNGMIKEIKDRKADIALGALSVKPEREAVVDFTESFYDLVGISILMKKPKLQTSLFKFLTVLENDVWMCILGAYFFTSLLMWIFDRWSPYSYQNNVEKYEEDEEKRIFNLRECLWFCMTSLTPQGGGEAPKNLSGRLVAATWWLFGFIIIASYTANLAAFLTVSRLDAPIESLDDLSKQYKVQYAPLEGSPAWEYFDRMAHVEHRFYEIWKDMSLNDSMNDFERSQLAVWDYPVSDRFTKMWQAMMENSPPKIYEEGIARVRGKEDKQNDGFAFVEEATNVRYQTIISCDFQEIGEEFSRKPYAIAVQKGSPLKDAISQAIMKLSSERYLEKLKETWWEKNPYKAVCPKEDNQEDGISIHNIGGVFIVIFVGFVLAVLSVLIEYLCYRRYNKANRIAEMALPIPREVKPDFSTEKTNFNTQYNKQSDLPSIDSTW